LSLLEDCSDNKGGNSSGPAIDWQRLNA